MTKISNVVIYNMDFFIIQKRLKKKKPTPSKGNTHCMPTKKQRQHMGMYPTKTKNEMMNPKLN